MEPTASDNCPVTIDANFFSGSLFPIGLTEVEYSITDQSGNQDSCSFFVLRYPLPIADAGEDREICEVDATALGGSPTGSGGLSLTYDYIWVPTTGLDDHTIANPTAEPGGNVTYTVFVIDQITGCAATDMVTTAITPAPQNGVDIEGLFKVTNGFGGLDTVLFLSLIHI